MTNHWLDAFSEAAHEGRSDDVYFIGRDETMITAFTRLNYRVRELWHLIIEESGLRALANALGIRPRLD